MNWFAAATTLAKRGILGINRRNATCILDYNPRALFPLVDDKRRMHDLCRRIGVPTPPVLAALQAHGDLRNLGTLLAECNDFVLKPNRGAAGRGVLVIVGRDGDRFVRSSGKSVALEEIRQLASDTISGLYSIGGQPDSALIQYRVRLHPAFDRLVYQGIPDVRVVLYRYEPALAMLRLPTRTSVGRANLHQGGIGAGIDLDSGMTFHAVQRDRFVAVHPDTGATVLQRRVPNWPEALVMAKTVARAVGLGFVGVDIVIDADHGPMLLEANARPGLAIQLANACGLQSRMTRIDERLDNERAMKRVDHPNASHRFASACS